LGILENHIRGKMVSEDKIDYPSRSAFEEPPMFSIESFITMIYCVIKEWWDSHYSFDSAINDIPEWMSGRPLSEIFRDDELMVYHSVKQVHDQVFEIAKRHIVPSCLECGQDESDCECEKPDIHNELGECATAKDAASLFDQDPYHDFWKEIFEEVKLPAAVNSLLYQFGSDVCLSVSQWLYDYRKAYLSGDPQEMLRMTMLGLSLMHHNGDLVDDNIDDCWRDDSAHITAAVVDGVRSRGLAYYCGENALRGFLTSESHWRPEIDLVSDSDFDKISKLLEEYDGSSINKGE
jgi:hypothetical protein